MKATSAPARCLSRQDGSWSLERVPYLRVGFMFLGPSQQRYMARHEVGFDHLAIDTGCGTKHDQISDLEFVICLFFFLQDRVFFTRSVCLEDAPSATETHSNSLFARAVLHAGSLAVPAFALSP